MKPDEARLMKARAGIDDDYYTAVATEPSPAELERIFLRATACLNTERHRDFLIAGEPVKRSITIACAGQHNLLMIGAPGQDRGLR